MDHLDSDEDLAEWVVIPDPNVTPGNPALAQQTSTENRNASDSSVPSSSPVSTLGSSNEAQKNKKTGKKDSEEVQIDGEVILSLPENIILAVLRFSSTNSHALYRDISLVCRRFFILAKKLPLELVYRPSMETYLPICNIVSLTVTVPITSEVIRNIALRYSHSLKYLKITHLNLLKEKQLVEDSLLPLGRLHKLHHLSLAWKSGPTIVPKSFSFLTHLSNLRSLSLDIYEKSPNSAIPSSSMNSPSHLSLALISSQPRSEGSFDRLDSSGCFISHTSPDNDASKRKFEGVIPAHQLAYSVIGPLAKINIPRPLFSPPIISSPLQSPSMASQSPSSSTNSSPRSTLNFSNETDQSLPSQNLSSQNLSNSSDSPIQKSISAGITHSPSSSKARSSLIQSNPASTLVKPAQTITASGITNPSTHILKFLVDLPNLSELSLSNWKDFGPLFLLAPLTKITSLTIKGRPSDLMPDGASVIDASKHFLSLATLAALRRLTLAWLPPCLPQLTRLTHLDLSQAPNITNQSIEDFSKTLLNLQVLFLDGTNSQGQITDEGVACLGRLQNIQLLDLSNNRLVTSEPFEHIVWPLVDLRLNHTSVSSMAPLIHFAPSLLHLHLQGCNQLHPENVSDYICFLEHLFTFRYSSDHLESMGGVTPSFLPCFSRNLQLVRLCDRVMATPSTLQLIGRLENLQYLELYRTDVSSSASSSKATGASTTKTNKSVVPLQTEDFSCLLNNKNLKSLVLTNITLTTSILKILASLPCLESLIANRLEESTSMCKALLNIPSLRSLSLIASDPQFADVMMKYVVQLPNLTYYEDGRQVPDSALPWTTRRRLYIEWHPRAVSKSKANNCTIS